MKRTAFQALLLAVRDPSFYNEYTDGRKLPPQVENVQAADQLSLWLLQQAAARHWPGASESTTTHKHR